MHILRPTPTPLAMGAARSRFVGRRVKWAAPLWASSGDDEDTHANDKNTPYEELEVEAGGLASPPLPVLAAGAVVVVVVLAALLGGLASGDGGATMDTATAGAGTLAGGASSGLTASQVYDPRTFQPVCGASDNVYRYLQGSALVVVGKENYETYAPLIAGGESANSRAHIHTRFFL
jgi:hypothetical protein